MTPIEFSAWIRGVNTALNGAMPSKELWAEVVKQAQGIGPTYPFAPAGLPTPRNPLGCLPKEPLPFDKRYAPGPREFVLGGAMGQQAGQEQR